MAHQMKLLAAEWRILIRQRSAWVVHILLLIGFFIALTLGQARVEREQALITSARSAELASIERAQTATLQYAQPGTLVIDYHRDPTDAFGYMNWFLVTHALKPSLPLSLLSTGQSDLQPNVLRVDFTSVFPDVDYELANVQALKLGAFDFAFMLIYLLPIGLIGLYAGRLNSERDAGILRALAASPLSLRQLAAAKFLIAALFSSVLLVGGVAAFLMLTEIAALSIGLLLVLIVMALWISFWIAICALVATLWRGAPAAVASAALTWLAVVFLVPTALAATIQAVQPSPSRIAYIDASRSAMDAFYADEKNIYRRWVATHVGSDADSDALITTAEVKRLARDAFYRDRLETPRSRFLEYRNALDRWTSLLQFASPALVVDHAFESAAGTDTQRHARFVMAADQYTGQLRQWFEPQVLGNIGRPQDCKACPARLNFNRYGEVPRFSATSFEQRENTKSTLLLAALYLAAITSLIALLARLRMRDWPA